MRDLVPWLAWALLALGGIVAYWVDEDSGADGRFRGFLVAYAALGSGFFLTGVMLGADPSRLLGGLAGVGALVGAILLLFRRQLAGSEEGDPEED